MITIPYHCSMNYLEIIDKTAIWVRSYMEGYDSSHNYKHILRVIKFALDIADTENQDNHSKFIITLSALTHDIADHKYENTVSQEKLLTGFFKDILSKEDMAEVIYIATNTSLSKEISSNNIDDNIRLKCVQDADRLDSLGAIGISRYFMYGATNKKSDIESIVDNLENRTNILMKHIKTDYAKKLSIEKCKIIRLFIEDFRSNI